MNRNSEDMWASVHCVSSVLKTISKKRNKSESRQSNNFLILDIDKSEQDNTLSLKSLFSHPSLRAVAESSLADSYKYNFSKTTSFSEKFKNGSKHEHDSRKHISLQKHTFGVLNKMYKLIGKKFGIHSELFYLAALLHDFGKSFELRKDKEIDTSVRHHTASAIYLEVLMSQNTDMSKESIRLLEKVCVVLRAHHTIDLANKFYAVEEGKNSMEMEILLLENLIKADSAQVDIDIEEGKKYDI